MSDLRERIGATVAARYREIHPDTNFFEAGLSSGLLADVLTDLRAGGLDVSLIDLYRYPTVAALSAELAGRSRPRPAAGAALPWTGRGSG